MDQIFLGNRYELLEEIGSGGMAHVFRARDTLLDRIVAIKILKPEYTEDTQFIERFRVEAKAAASLSNSNIVMIYDVGQDDGIYYIIMEYVDGITLKEYISKAGRIPWKEAVTLAVQMSQAIDSAHSNNIIHRDIKPQNILLTRDRKIKITDFGIARAASSATITTVGNAMGSVHYFSPEQAKGSLTDEKSDIYSLGITLYEMLTGSVPFEGETPIAVALKHIQEIPISPSRRNPQVPAGLDAIILRAIAKDKFDRYQSMGEMLADLKKVIKDPSGKTLQYASAYRLDNRDWSRGNNAAARLEPNRFPEQGIYPRGGEPRAGELRGGEPRAGDPRGGEYRVGDYRDGEYRSDEYRDGEYRDGEYRDGEYRDGEYREERYPAGAYNPTAHGAARQDRANYGNMGGYPQNAYGQGGGAGANTGTFAGANTGAYAGYNGADNNYALNPYGGGYPDAGGYPNAGAYPDAGGYPNAGAYPDTGVYPNAGGYPDAGVYPDAGGYPAGGYPAGGYGAGGYPVNANGAGAAMRNGDKKMKNQRSGDNYNGGRRGGKGGYTGIFIAVVLVAVIAAIVFILWIMNNLFNIFQPPALNQGADGFTVGNYVGRVYSEVSEELRRSGIKSQENRVPNDIVDEGIIVKQSVDVGWILMNNGPDAILFEVSDGPRRFTVPDYREYETDYRTAEKELRDNNLDVSIVDMVSNTVKQGNVVRTDPGPNTQLSAGAKITIYRSSGYEASPATVPQLIGKTYKEARSILIDANLSLGIVTPESPLDAAIVIRQSPSPNSVVDTGVPVDLWCEESEPTTEETTTEEQPEPSPSPTPTPTAEPEDTPTPSPTGDEQTTNTAPGDAATTTPENTRTPRPTVGGGEQNSTVITGQPIDMSIRLKLPAEREYGDTIKVLVEATPSDTGRTTRLLNRSVKKDDFPKSVEFTIPADGTIEIKVYYDGELMVTRVYPETE